MVAIIELPPQTLALQVPCVHGYWTRMSEKILNLLGCHHLLSALRNALPFS